MYADSDAIARPPIPSASQEVITRPTLQTRPPVQRLLIRSWEYNSRPVRIAVFAIRLLVAAWLVVLGAILLSGGYAVGAALIPAAAAVAAIGLWVYRTASAGWPVDAA
jgi:hypothetical protein